MSLNKTGLVVVLVVIVVIASAGVYYFTSQEEDGKTVLKPGSYAKYNLEGTAVSDNPSMTFDIEGDANLVVVAVIFNFLDFNFLGEFIQLAAFLRNLHLLVH